ncbi:protein maelstrom homolog isoform X2 [Alligator sinensis]|uniref:Protein maelstrom homolog n=1 Tax=Alligator sinensis TaxID=38654 RepID=A0A1U7R852_ALLSI|nr:protein maelstrom homolog isoform X2 [Alligator sinensis]
MPNRKGARNAYYYFALHRLPELRRLGLPVARVVDAIPYCSQDWALLTEDEKEKYAEMARQWKSAKSTDASVKQLSSQTSPIPAHLPIQIQKSPTLPNATNLPGRNDQEEVPCGFRYHCQAASDATHKIPVSGFELSNAAYPLVLHELYKFVQPNQGSWPLLFCKSNDWHRVNWCLKHMAKKIGIENKFELRNVEDLVVELYQQKLQKEPSKTWVRSQLDVSIWDYSSNTRCKWHEENDILICALASCKKITYCISSSLANVYGISLTEAHLPLQDCISSNNPSPKVAILDAGRFQKLRAQDPWSTRYFTSPVQDQGSFSSGDSPSGVKMPCGKSTVKGRGVVRFLENLSNVPKSSSS